MEDTNNFIIYPYFPYNVYFLFFIVQLFFIIQIFIIDKTIIETNIKNRV